MSFKRILAMILIISSLGSLAHAEWNRIVGDIEGISKRWQQLAKEGVISFGRNGAVSLNDGHALSFEGDLMKRGPYGKATIDLILSLAKKYNKDSQNPRVRLVLGNHDLNTLSLIQWLPIMELGQAPQFNTWLAEKNRKNDFISRLDYWLQINGVNDKMNWFWLEVVAEKLRQNPLDPTFKAEYYPEGKPLIEKLAGHMPQEEAYRKFFEYVKPDGPLWNLYGQAKIVDSYSRGGKARFLSFHSGILTTGNFGIVPGESDGLFERAVREYMSAQAEDIFRQYDFSKIEDVQRFEKRFPGFTYKAVELWTDRYNEFVQQELNEIRDLFGSLKGNSGFEAMDPKNKTTLSKANRLYANRMAALGDAGWDPVTGKLSVEANSLVYPDSRAVKGSSIPGLPEDYIVKVLGLAKIDFVTGGHQPVGDGMIHRTARAFGQDVQFLLTDTSFSPIEQEDFVRVRDDGYLQFKAKLRDGTALIIERPGNEERLKNQELVNKYQALSEESRAKLSAEAKSKYQNLEKRTEAINKLGMMANGWLIVGFAQLINEKGQISPDYDNFILFQKQGYNMVYKKVDIWGITAPDVKLEYAKADLDEMSKKAKLDKIEDLKKHGKEVLNTLGFERLVRGKNVMVISGPASNSLTKALKSADAQAALDNYKSQFKTWLQQLPANQQWVFIGGGTQGFEEELNKIIVEVSRERTTPFEVIGVVAGVSGGAEFDKSVKKYLPLTKAFYWDDYFTELLPLLTKTKRAQAAQIKFLFAGGGAIVGKQIREVVAEQDKGAKIEISLLPGLSASMSVAKDISATDQFIASDLGRSLVGERIKLINVNQKAMVAPLALQSLQKKTPSAGQIIECRSVWRVP